MDFRQVNFTQLRVELINGQTDTNIHMDTVINVVPNADILKITKIDFLQ